MWRSFVLNLRSKLHKNSKRYNSNSAEAATTSSANNTEPSRLITYKDVKNALLRRTLFVKVSTVVAILGGLGVLTTYFIGWEDTPEKKLDEAMAFFRLQDKSYKIDGFDKLSKLFVTKRVFSGPVDIPVSDDALVNETVLKTLVQNVPVVSGPALAWIHRLVNHSSHTGKARDILAHMDGAVDVISETITKGNYSEEKEWILASHVLFSLAEAYPKLLGNNKSLLNAIVSLSSSSNPLALATACRLHCTLGFYSKLDDPETRLKISKMCSSSMNSVYKDLTNVGLNYVQDCSQLVLPCGPYSSPVSIAFFTTFATLWGNLMWRASTTLSPQLSKIAANQDPKRVHTLYKQFLRHRMVGRVVFGLLSFDYLASLLLQFTTGAKLGFSSNSPISFTTDSKVPLSSLYPVIQTTLFMMGTLFAIHSQRFVVVPLVLAGSYYNMDILESIPAFSKAVEVVRRVESHNEMLYQKAKTFLTGTDDE